MFFLSFGSFWSEEEEKKIGTPWGGERTPFSFRTVVDLEKINLAESGEKKNGSLCVSVVSRPRPVKRLRPLVVPVFLGFYLFSDAGGWQ